MKRFTAYVIERDQLDSNLMDTNRPTQLASLIGVKDTMFSEREQDSFDSVGKARGAEFVMIFKDNVAVYCSRTEFAK